MRRGLVFVAVVFGLVAAEDDYVFRSDVSLVRVDAQVVDRTNRAITGLIKEDFVIRENGVVQQIRNFAREEMPVDVLLLLDVSGSMRPHIERLAAASDSAAQVLGRDDRLGIMVFDRQTRMRMPLRPAQGDISYAFDALLREETFNGGTDITRALYDAADYVQRDGRRNARRAIVILTDDQTERGRDEHGVGAALARGDIVLSALIAPDAMGSGPVRVGGGGGTGWPGSGGGGWPGSRGGGGWPGLGGPLGGIILGGPRGGSRFPGGGGGGPVITRGNTSSAGTRNIAIQSGGDSFNVDEAAAFENTLQRLRQRYALYFQLPEGIQPGQERNIQVELTAQTMRRYSGAEVHYRRLNDTGAPSNHAPVVISSAPQKTQTGTSSSNGGWRKTDEPAGEQRPTLDSQTAASSTPAADTPPVQRRPAVSGGEGGSRGADIGSTTPSPATTTTDSTANKQPTRGGWRRLKPGEQP